MSSQQAENFSTAVVNYANVVSIETLPKKPPLPFKNPPT